MRMRKNREFTGIAASAAAAALLSGCMNTSKFEELTGKLGESATGTEAAAGRAEAAAGKVDASSQRLEAAVASLEEQLRSLRDPARALAAGTLVLYDPANLGDPRQPKSVGAVGIPEWSEGAREMWVTISQPPGIGQGRDYWLDGHGLPHGSAAGSGGFAELQFRKANAAVVDRNGEPISAGPGQAMQFCQSWREHFALSWGVDASQVRCYSSSAKARREAAWEGAAAAAAPSPGGGASPAPAPSP